MLWRILARPRSWDTVRPPSTALKSHLPEVAYAYGLSVDQLTERLLADQTLAVDSNQKLFYTEATLAEQAAGLAEPVVAASAPEALAPLEDTFLLHSRPGAQRIIYLDFDGHVLSGTVWNDSYNGGANIVCPAWDIEGGASVFTDTERTRIQQVWQRVAEDYAPFDVDVTTEYPGEAALTRSNTSDAYYGMRVLISPISSYIGSYGGVAYIGVFDAIGDYYKPALVFPENLANGEKYIGEASSHENGHTLGLYHDGVTGGDAYYSGHGTGETGWAPIMGNGYYKNLTQWSKGEYTGANNTEDDLAVMLTNGVSYRSDDHGDSPAAATPLPAGANPERERIHRPDGRRRRLLVRGGRRPRHRVGDAGRTWTNLDVLLELRDSAGALLASSNPADALAASLSTSVTAGTYYLTVKGTGKGDPSTGYSNYASLGAYTLSATLTPPAPTTYTVTPSAGPGGTHLAGDRSDRECRRRHHLHRDPRPGLLCRRRAGRWRVGGAGGFLRLHGCRGRPHHRGLLRSSAPPPSPLPVRPDPSPKARSVPVAWNVAAPASTGWFHVYAYRRHLLLPRQPGGDRGRAPTASTGPSTQPAGTGYVVRIWYVDGSGNWLVFDDSSPTFAITAGTLPVPTVTQPSHRRPLRPGSSVLGGLDVAYPG